MKKKLKAKTLARPAAVLVVEDEKELRKTLAMWISSHGSPLLGGERAGGSKDRG